ncbi:MAG: hypothetical protein WA990_05600 [Rubrobacteraceae bacterium]
MRSRQSIAPRKHRVWSTVVIGVLLATTLVMVVKPAQSTVKPAKRADSFVGSIGVNTHFRFLDTAYNEKYPLVKKKLDALGVRNVRDGAFISPHDRVNDLVYGRYRELARMGLRFNLIVDPRKEGLRTVDSAKIAKIASMVGPSLNSLEGPNEYNLSDNANWAADLTAYQKNLYNAVKSNSSTKNKPVVGPSLGRPYPDKKPDLSAYADYANMHSYPGGRIPSDWGLDNYIIPAARKVGGSKPLMATETGYHTAANWNGPHSGVSEKAMGKYTSRLALEYFNRNIAKTYTYELIDQKPDPKGTDREENFGLLRNDGTEKPAYRALKNLIYLLEDPGPRFKPDSLNYSLGGDLKNVRRTLLQKRDGTFYLVLWQEASSYDPSAGRDISVPTRKVTLTLNQSVGATATYLPNASVSPVKKYAAPKQLALNVPDQPLIVELAPSSGAPKATNQKPKILDIKPSRNARVKDRTPSLRAKVTDDSNLKKANVKLLFDGKRQTKFSYDRSRDLMKFNVRKKLKVGSYYRVKIVARDNKGLRTVKKWRFKVVQRR